MECFLVTIALAMTLTNDTPKTIAIEDCNGVDRYSYLVGNEEVEVVDYLEDEAIYIVREIK